MVDLRTLMLLKTINKAIRSVTAGSIQLQLHNQVPKAANSTATELSVS